MLTCEKLSILLAIVFGLILLGQNGSSELLQSTEENSGLQSLEDDEVETTVKSQTADPPECYTNKGEVGECIEFQKCFPMLTFNFGNTKYGLNATIATTTSSDEDIENLLSSYKNLHDEFFTISRTSSCNSKANASETEVCCEINDLITSDNDSANSSDEILQNETVNPSSESTTESILPVSCGIAKTSGFSRVDRSIKISPKVTGGRVTLPNHHPWMVAIFGTNGKQTCGGSLISNEFVLSAAHCFFSYNGNDISKIKVHIGDYNIMSLRDGPHETRKVSKIILHKGFNIKNYHNDIALIKLDKPVNFTDKIQPICLPTEDFKNSDVEGKTVVVTGWGRDRQWGQASSILKMVEMPVWKFEACQKVFNIFAPNRLMEFNNICAGDGKRNKDACTGDSGSPMADRIEFRWTQLGIVSWGKGCGSFPGVYTSTRAYLSWIKNQLNK